MKRRWLTAILIAFSLGASQPDVLSGPLVVSDRWPQATNLVAWTRDVMRLEGLEHATETAQAKAFFRWLRLFSRMATGGMIQAYEGERGKETYVTDAHKSLFVYGWGYCDTTSRIAEAAWAQFKNDSDAAERVCLQHSSGGYHTMYRLRLDGRFGAFDPRYGYYLVDRDSSDARILDWAEVGADENITRNKTFHHRSQPFFEFFGREWTRALAIQPAYFSSEAAWIKAGSPAESVFGDRKYVPGARYHSMDFVLPRGASIERFWSNAERKFYVPAGAHTRKEEAFLPSGRFYRVTESMFNGNWPKNDPNYALAQPYLVTVPRDEGYNPGVAGGRTIGQAWGRITWTPRPEELGDGLLDLYSPYVLVDATLSGEAIDGARFEVRTLRAKAGDASEPDYWSEWATLRPSPGKFNLKLGTAHGVYRLQVRVDAAKVKGLKLESSFEIGIMSIPRIFAGSNTVRFLVQDGSALRGTVTVIYRYQTDRGERTYAKVLRAGDFHYGAATWQIEAPGLIRCNSVTVKYD